ncbi:MAG TPA: YigZ family protein, partial [Lysinibacillus sp.]|nr:YigZ family protein [Lysinibacillus sp.]
VENEVRGSSYSLEDIRYLEGVEIIVSVLKEEEEQFRNWMTEITNGQASITFEDAQFIEFIVK